MSNPYNNFRRPGGTSGFNTISKRFDQPTFLSFKLDFAPMNDWNFNGGGLGTLINYDIMPHPLFMPEGNSVVEDRLRYSAIDYLLDAQEFTRAKMLQQWIVKFNALQNNYPWYFKKISGLEEILTPDPAYGMRIKKDAKLTITAMEGLDLRMSHLLNMYRKIAWDDTYQRWVLPDMMRYFTLNVYIAEFRTFHTPNSQNAYGVATPGGDDGTIEQGDLWLKLLDSTLPTWTIKCEMCEFDISSTKFGYLSELGVDGEPEEAGVTFDIKVGKIFEEQVYPTFQNMFLLDKNLNGSDRSIENDDEGEFDSTSEDANNNSNLGKYKLGLAQDTLGQFPVHKSTMPWNENANSDDLFGVPGGGPSPGKSWVGNAINFGASYATNALDSFVDKAKTTEIPGLGLSATEIMAAVQSKDIVSTLGLVKKGIDQQAADYGPSALLESQINNTLFLSFLQDVATSTATDKTSETDMFFQLAAQTALSDRAIFDKIIDKSKATISKGDSERLTRTRSAVPVSDLSKATVSEGDQEVLDQTVIYGLNSDNLSKATVSEGDSELIDQTRVYAPINPTDNDLSKATVSEGDLEEIDKKGAYGVEKIDRSLATDLDNDAPKTIKLTEIFEAVPTSMATSGTIIKG